MTGRWFLQILDRVLPSLKSWRLDAQTKGLCLNLSGDGLTATKTGNACHSNSTVIGNLPMEYGLHRWRCQLKTTAASWILFGVIQGQTAPQDENIYSNVLARGWTTAAQSYQGGAARNSTFGASTGLLDASMELQCDVGSRTATLRATVGGRTDTITGISLPVRPIFNLHTLGNSVTIQVLV